MSKPRIIALYLPQYHPFPENDAWWGKGFTEWRSVARAKSLFKGHYQPKIPADLGFYDLRLPIIRQQQADLAKEAGIEGFCYWHYWFGNGKQLMNGIIDDVIKSGTPSLPFCLGWANHSWYAKNWNTNDTKGADKLLIEQTFPGAEDIRKHYEYVLMAFKDPRYIKVGNKPFFMIYFADGIPSNFISLWNTWAIEDGFDGIYFVGNIDVDKNSEYYIERGFSSVIKGRMKKQIECGQKSFHYKFKSIMNKIGLGHFVKPLLSFDYGSAYKYFVTEEEKQEELIPCIIPNFDHSPRSGRYGYILYNSTPSLFKKHVEDVFEKIQDKENKIVLLRSWNEWGEGNYMEPDLQWGNSYIRTLREVFDKY